LTKILKPEKQWKFQ